MTTWNDNSTDIQSVLSDLLDQIQLMETMCDRVSSSTEPQHRAPVKKFKKRTNPSKKKKLRIFSSSEDDSSSSDDSTFSGNENALINDDSNDDDDEQVALRDRQGPRTKNELTMDDLPPIENLTINLSEETPIELLGHVRYFVDGKLVIIEALLHSPPLNDDSVLFNRDRRSIGLIFETFGPVEKPYYSVRYNNMDSIRQRQIEIGQQIFYAPKETAYTKYVFVQELRALKGSDASWEDDNEPPKFAIDYSDDEQESAAKALQRGKRQFNETNDDQSMDFESFRTTNSASNQFRRGRGRGRGNNNRVSHQGGPNRPVPNIPNWFQNTSGINSFQTRASNYSPLWQSGNTASMDPNSSYSNTPRNDNSNTDLQPSQPSGRGTYMSRNVFPWM